MVITLYPNGSVAEYVGDMGRVWEAVPAADVVEVVRCKDCKYGKQLIDANGFRYLLCSYRNGHGLMVEDTGYCKWGTKGDDNDR